MSRVKNLVLCHFLVWQRYVRHCEGHVSGSWLSCPDMCSLSLSVGVGTKILFLVIVLSLIISCASE